MSAVSQGAGPSAAASALTGLARALVQQGKLRPDRAESLARKGAKHSLMAILNALSQGACANALNKLCC